MSSESEGFRRSADQLSEVLEELDKVDLNPMLADDVRTVLDARDDLQEVCLRLRQDQHSVEREEGDDGG